jgi:hypothetical protein
MPELPTILPAKERRHHKRRMPASAPAPVTGPQIVSVTFGEDPTQMNVVVGADLVSVDSSNAMRIFIPGLYWVGSNSVDLVDATHLTITFTESVAAGTMWMTPFPEVWEFVSGEAMVPPFNGAIG